MIKSERSKCGICTWVLLRKEGLQDYDFMWIYSVLEMALKTGYSLPGFC